MNQLVTNNGGQRPHKLCGGKIQNGVDETL